MHAFAIYIGYRLRNTVTSHPFTCRNSLLFFSVLSVHCCGVSENQEEGGLSLHFLYRALSKTVELEVNGECFRISKRNTRPESNYSSERRPEGARKRRKDDEE